MYGSVALFYSKMQLLQYNSLGARKHDTNLNTQTFKIIKAVGGSNIYRKQFIRHIIISVKLTVTFNKGT